MEGPVNSMLESSNLVRKIPSMCLITATKTSSSVQDNIKEYPKASTMIGGIQAIFLLYIPTQHRLLTHRAKLLLTDDQELHLR
jgi:hypothetical protein